LTFFATEPSSEMYSARYMEFG